MTREQFENLKPGEYVQITQHGFNRGKIGIVQRRTSYRTVELMPYKCHFEFASTTQRRDYDDFNYEALKYLGRDPEAVNKNKKKLHN